MAQTINPFGKKIIKVSTDFCGRELSLEVGRVGFRTSASVLARYGDTVVLGTAMVSPEAVQCWKCVATKCRSSSRTDKRSDASCTNRWQKRQTFSTDRSTHQTIKARASNCRSIFGCDEANVRPMLVMTAVFMVLTLSPRRPPVGAAIDSS